MMLQNDIPGVLSTLEAWCTSCDHILTDLEEQVQRANEMKQADVDHKNQIEAQVNSLFYICPMEDAIASDRFYRFQ